MKFSWIEVIVDGNEILIDGNEILIDGNEILIDGNEILDGEGNSYEPPQYEQVSQEPPQYEQVSQDPPQYEQVSQDPPQYEQVGSGNGDVTGLNRVGGEGENTNNCSPQDLIYGMDTEAYKVVDRTFTPLTESEKAILDAERQAQADADAQAEADEAQRQDDIQTEIDSDGLSYLTVEQIDEQLDIVYDHTDFDAATDFASLKLAIGEIFQRQKGLDRKIALRIGKIGV